MYLDDDVDVILSIIESRHEYMDRESNSLLILIIFIYV